ncbi:hypothetical protein SAMN05443636_1105 [Halobaculum gomorrense]|uniref:Uncharacterized protein n=2 Tax=Halobaculum gomorrense TaxID=43928 RepID=A0A1M5MQN6_9EURY|nr:hypothetical protein SAMN05443636_1105 [Halobaculum gomorrense]
MLDAAAPVMVAFLVFAGLAFGDRVAAVVSSIDTDESLTDWESQ